jgi:hypothetical protein
MSQLSKHFCFARERTRALRPKRRDAQRAALILAATLLSAMTTLSSAHAQTWSTPSQNPALWQIVDIDRSGEPGWPYGSEDLADDGSSFQADEAGADLRSVYADAGANRLWLRAYVASENMPPAALRAFFFLDVDARDNSGGPAHGDELDPLLGTDLTFRGYERAFAVQADGEILGAFQWNASSAHWEEIPNRMPQALRAEVGRAPDPLELGSTNHGYLQVDVAPALSMLSAGCGRSTLFVRTVYDDTAARSFGDDALEEFTCSAALDPYGDPEVLRSAACDSDGDCPADGVCRDGVCLFAYACSGAADCRTNEACSAGVCVRQVDDPCSADDDCEGLVCEDSMCVACSESGARACGAGLTCSPNGGCVDTNDFRPGGSETKVQGGALTCSAGSAAGGAAGLWGCACLLGLVLRRRRARGQRSAASKPVGG